MRDADLQSFIDALETAVRATPPVAPPLAALAGKIFSAARHDLGTPASNTAETLPVCQHLAPALVAAATRSRETAAVADAFSHLAPRLVWRRRPASPNDPEGFGARHANTTLVGVDGLEVRDDIRIGASLVAPNTDYPDHSHPPEEMYLVLSEGEWRNTDNDWHAPGIGGLVHNPPGIVHAMRAGATPLLAVWCLWTG